MQVCNITTPGNYFHLLRRQVKNPYRLPLVVMSPKNLLRLPEATSDFSELTSGCFKEVIDDTFNEADAAKVKQIILCTGKFYYDLAARKASGNRSDVAIIRMEQIAPLPVFALSKVLSRYINATTFLWAQEEPQNMGSWPYLLRKFSDPEINQALGGVQWECISRKEGSSPATGYKKQHDKEQLGLLDKAFGQQSEKTNKTNILVSK